NSSKKKHSIQ
ncbi:2',3'-cyclic-nucleotide 2'-phosphodiesterase/3'-nucleotidase precursor, partial [Haemophilus influenzae]